MSRAILDERLIPDLVSGFFVSRCTIQAHDGTKDSHGQPSTTGWANVTGAVDIPCADWSPKATERGTEQFTNREVNRMAVLAGAFSIASDRRAVIGSRAYDVLGAEQTSHGRLTKLWLELVQT